VQLLLTCSCVPWFHPSPTTSTLHLVLEVLLLLAGCREHCGHLSLY